MQPLLRKVASRALRPLHQTPRRALATEGPQVSWAQYRSGDKTLEQWVDANRHIVAGSMFAFYVSLAAWNLRPGKKKSAEITPQSTDSSPSPTNQ